jgi:hypothetical protein
MAATAGITYQYLGLVIALPRAIQVRVERTLPFVVELE